MATFLFPNGGCPVEFRLWLARCPRKILLVLQLMLLLLVLQLSASSSVTTPQTVLTVKDQPRTQTTLLDDDLRAKEGGTRVSLALRVCLCARNEAPEGEEAS